MSAMAKIIETPTIHTKRLLLRPLRLEDSNELEKYFNNWNIIQHLNERVPWPYPDGASYDFYKNEAMPRIETGEAFFWTIIKNNAPIGLIELRREALSHTDGHRGFWLGEAFWGQGLMTEAVTAVNDFGFFELGLKEMILENHKDNIASHRVKEKTGSTLLRTVQKENRGQIIDIEVWELTAENWRQFRKKL